LRGSTGNGSRSASYMPGARAPTGTLRSPTTCPPTPGPRCSTASALARRHSCGSPGVPFTSLTGRTVTLGLLPVCPFPRPGHPVAGPCVQSIRYSTFLPLPSEKGTVTEQLVLPPNDPFSH
jgi:hypothetical protein